MNRTQYQGNLMGPRIYLFHAVSISNISRLYTRYNKYKQVLTYNTPIALQLYFNTTKKKINLA